VSSTKPNYAKFAQQQPNSSQNNSGTTFLTNVKEGPEDKKRSAKVDDNDSNASLPSNSNVLSAT